MPLSRHELLNDKDQSLDWYQQMLNFVPSDPSLLNKLSDIADAELDKQQAFSYLSEVRHFARACEKFMFSYVKIQYEYF